jgi:hypothetical protein
MQIYIVMFCDLLPTKSIVFDVKINLLVKAKSDQDPDPHWFGSLDPYPDLH